MAYDLFVSYAHADNRRGQVRELRDAIAREFVQFAGRELAIFFDETEIHGMAAWEQRIGQALRDSRLFLAVVSPTYRSSPYCRRECEEYLRYEAMRHCLGEGVAAVYFVELPDLVGGVATASDWLTDLRKRQWFDLRPWHAAGERALADRHVAERLTELRTELGERLGRADRAQQSPTNVYRHNPQFVGRIRELTLLRQALNERGTVGVVGHTHGAQATAVHGVGGMGKTELGLAYAHAFAWDYPGGRWLVPCDGISSFPLVLIRLANAIGITLTEAEKVDEQRAAERVLRELSQRERTLLLLDNVSDPALLAPDVLMRLPGQGRLHLLATTRLGPSQLAGSPQDHTFVAVDELPEGDALALLRAHQPEGRFVMASDDEAARALVTLLGGFTLAVETAAIHLGRNAQAGYVAGYLERLRTDVLGTAESTAGSPSVAVRHKEKLLAKTLEVTFEDLSRLQMHVLTIAALLPPDQIGEYWVRELAAQEFPVLGATDVDDQRAWTRLLDSLMDLRLLQPALRPQHDSAERRSLLQMSERLFVVRMHRLVQELLRKRAGEALRPLEKSLIAHVRTRADTVGENWETWHSRWEVESLAAYAWDLVSRRHHTGARLAIRVAGPLDELAKHAEAERLLRSAIELLPGDSAALHAMGLHCIAVGRLREAEPLLRAALDNELRVAGESLAVATFAASLGHVLFERNCLQEAEALIRQALRIEERAHGAYHPTVALSLSVLGSLLLKKHESTEAEACFRRALSINEGLPDQPLRKIRSEANLAVALCETNQLGDAEILCRGAVLQAELHLGRDHPEVGRLLDALAAILHRAGRYEEAAPLVRRALDISERHFGPTHPKLAAPLVGVGVHLCKENKGREAEPYLRRALAIYEQSLGPRHPEVGNVALRLADALADSSRLQEAEVERRRGLAILEASLGAEHPDVAQALASLAVTHVCMSQWSEAEPLLRRALAIDEKARGPQHPAVAEKLHALAFLLHGSRRSAEAEPLMERAVRILIAFVGNSGHRHPHEKDAVSLYAAILAALGKSEADIRTTIDGMMKAHFEQWRASFMPKVKALLDRVNKDRPAQ